MTAPVLDGFAAELYQRLAPWAVDDDRRGWALAHLCAAIGSQWEELDSLVVDAPDGTPGWARVFDPDTCPVFLLPWLAQFAGVQLTVGLTEAQHRAEIKAMAGLTRGTPAAIIAAAQLHLTGEKRVRLFERDGGNAYQLRVVTFTAETPDPAKVEAALRSQKPIGLVLTYEVLDGWTYADLEAAYDGKTYADLAADFATYEALRTNLPA